MKVITKETLAREAPDQFGSRDERPLSYLPMEERTVERVSALISEQLGGRLCSWLSVPDCDECGKTPDLVIELGEQIDVEDYEHNRIDVCADCLRKALAKCGP